MCILHNHIWDVENYKPTHMHGELIFSLRLQTLFITHYWSAKVIVHREIKILTSFTHSLVKSV